MWIRDRLSVLVDSMMLKQTCDEIHVEDVASVAIAPEVEPQEIRKRLHFSDCAMIHCSPSQRSMVELVSEDVGQINDSDEEEQGIKKLLQLTDTKVVNASSYVF